MNRNYFLTGLFVGYIIGRLHTDITSNYMGKLLEKKVMIYHHFNFPPAKGEEITEPSITNPEKKQTIDDIIKKVQRGLGNIPQKVAIYNGNVELPDINTMDLADQQTFREAAADNLARIRKDIADENARQKEAEEQALKEKAEQAAAAASAAAQPGAGA